MRTQNYVAGAIDDPIGGVCCTITEELFYCLVCAFCCGGLLGANGTKADK